MLFLSHSNTILKRNRILPNHSDSGKCRPPRKPSAECQILFRGQEIFPDSSTPSDIDQNISNDCILEELVKDCPRLRSEHGYDDKPVSNEELNFPLAFSIKMHENAYQMEQLLRTIYRPHNIYCIHVDSKTSHETYGLIKNMSDCLQNVIVISKRINVIHSSIRLVTVELACMKHCMESNIKWKYYINLTGQEFILRTNLELVEILKIFNGANDIEGYRLDLLWRVKEKMLVTENDIFIVGTNTPFKYNITLYKGSAYGMFSRDFVNFVLTDEIAIQFYQWLGTTYAPEETIWSTLNRLPFAPGGYRGFDVKHDDQTHVSKTVLWAYEHIKCHGKYVRGVCIFTSGDLPWLHSRPEIAANKFYKESGSSVVLDCLEEWVNRRTYSASLEGLNWYHYRNLPHVKYYKKLKDSQKTKEYLKKQKEIWLKKFNPKKTKPKKDEQMTIIVK